MSMMMLIAALAGLQTVKDTPTPQIDPAGTYLMVRTGAPTGLAFYREPTADEQAKYTVKHDTALARAHGKWVDAHAAWLKEVAEYNSLTDNQRELTPRPSPEPIEPTATTFEFAPLELQQMTFVGPLNRFAKGANSSVYLEGVKPGIYDFYGPIAMTSGPVGRCLCMGSIKFEVVAGRINDAGTVGNRLTDAALAARAGAGPKVANEFALPEASSMIYWKPAAQSAPVDPRLNGAKVVPVIAVAGGPYANFYKIEVDRLDAVPGVLRYDRDHIVDVATAHSAR